MLMMEYGSQYAPSTMSSETLSGSCGSRTNRIRTIRLIRPNNGNLPPPNLTCRHGPSLGFSVRGGREHGTGFFVSCVEAASEAHRQGLMVGDQIIRVNGFTVDDAVHKEVLQLISNQTHLTLKVRSVGMIPVKDRKTDVLSWQIITDNNSMRSSPPLGEKIHDVRVNILVAPRSKLGCGICKGPDWKPGIFIQFTKEAGVAREAGLRPGDQILLCNNVDFSDIPFNEAVNLMKSSRQLELFVRKGAGSELFPGESSGYNSSSSSVTGDQSPSWSDSKRLSIVKEESMDLEDRLDRLKNKKWEKINWDEHEEDKQIYKPTIINLSENGTTITNNGTEQCLDDTYSTISSVTGKMNEYQQVEMKTVVVEVHRSDVKEEPSQNKTEDNTVLAKSASASSFGSMASRSSSNTSCSLSSALCQEIQRRTEKQKVEGDSKPMIDEQLQLKKLVKGVSSVSSDQHSQHNKLMDEFKMAHRRMFKANPNGKVEEDKPKDTTDRMADQALSQKLSERLTNLQIENSQNGHLPASRQNSEGTVKTAPPPPPLPMLSSSEATTPNSTKTNTPTPTPNKPKKAPPVPVKLSTLSFRQPPPCPTPDYDTLSIASSASSKRNGFAKSSQPGIHDTVEMDSLDSYVLYNGTSNGHPKPPSTYFHNKSPLTQTMSTGSMSSSSSTLRKTPTRPRPVSVTIGEYPSNTIRKKPGKLDFLNNNNNNDYDEVVKTSKPPITSQFATELAQTLNRSNLRRRTESMANGDQ